MIDRPDLFPDTGNLGFDSQVEWIFAEYIRRTAQFRTGSGGFDETTG